MSGALAVQDSLRSVRNNFYLGLWNACLREVESLRKDGDPSLGPHAEIFHYRVLQRLRPELLAQEIGKDASTGLQAVRMWAGYQQLRLREREAVAGGSPVNAQRGQAAREGLFGTLREWLGFEGIGEDPTLRLMAAHIFLEEGLTKEALELVKDSEDNLEHLAVAVQIYFQLHRLDLARRTIVQMQSLDDDDVLTLLAQAQLQLAAGGGGTPEQLSECSYLLQDLLEKFGPSVVVLNTLAACQIAQGDSMSAFKQLREARELALRTEGKPDPVTLVNSIVCLRRLQRDPAIIDKIIAQLRKLDPANAWLREHVDLAEEKFEQAAAAYQRR